MAPASLPSTAAPTDDSDLEDLISKSPAKSSEKFSLESLTSDERPRLSPLRCITDTCRLCLYSYPKCLLPIFVLLLLSLVFALLNPTYPMGIMGGDYSAIHSAYDLSLSKVDHWCISGDNESCTCEDPLEPQHRQEYKSWSAAHKANVADVSLYRANYGEDPTMVDEESGKTRPKLDVAFLGESVVEAMDGRWLGKNIFSDGRPHGENEKNDLRRIDKASSFQKKFRKDKGGSVEGVALGIAGDSSSNVLWRIQHEEMPYDFNPKIWWLVLGMNDLTRMQCSEEIVVLGILRVVEEIRLRKPDAKIVINSLLPMVNYQSIEAPTMADAVDFAEKDDKKTRDRTREVPPSGGKGGNNDDERRHVRALQNKQQPRRNDAKDRSSKPRNKRDRERMEDNATKGPDLEKAMERKKKELAKADKYIRDKVFRDDEKYHPKKPITPLIPIIKKKQLPPVWPAVHLINDKLKEFCTKHDSITFFDATPIFASNEGKGRHHLYTELISPRGHPSPQGFSVWEGEMLSHLHQLLKEITVDVPIAKSALEGSLTEDTGSEHVSEGKEAELPKVVKSPKIPGRKPQSAASDDAYDEEDEGDD